MNREAMVRLRTKQGGRRVDKLHWSEMNAQRRCDAVARIADLAGFMSWPSVPRSLAAGRNEPEPCA